jgi:Tfp pilus assembly protein PilF
MQSRWFWKAWVTEYRWMWYALGSMLLLSIILLWFFYFKGTDLTMHWEKLHDQQTIETVSHSFTIGNFEFAIPIESYVTYEYFNGSSFQLNEFIAYAFLLILVVCSIILFTIITTFSRFWYLVGTSLFILLIVSLRLDVLRVLYLPNQWFTIATILLYGIPSFYFNAFKTEISFTKRLASFLFITILITLAIHFLSAVNYPFLHLWVSGYTPAIILTTVFILIIGHEIVASFIFLVSQGTSSSKSLRHFSIISVVYVTNLILLFMHEAEIINWNFVYINVYLLFTVSGILAIWGYKNREPLYENIMSFHPIGAFFITSLATIGFITIATFLGTGNDSALKVIRDLIIFSHLGLGVIFLTYVISNFILMLAENYNVYKVLYKPNRMPFITFRIAGLIAVLGFIFYSNWRLFVYHGFSGFFNNLGDLYIQLDKNGLARAYYEQSKTYSLQNHHANYALADQRARSGDFDKAFNNYDLANDKRPTPYSLANEGNLHIMRGNVFAAIHVYRDGLRKVPGDGALQNNLGYAFAKVHNLDSALHMLELARTHTFSKQAAEANFAAFLCQEFIPVQADSLQDIFEPTPLLRSNLLAISALHKQEFKTNVDPLQHTQLNLFTATQLHNYIVQNVKSLDSTFLNKAFRIANDSVNLRYREALKLSLAHAFYHHNYVDRAFEIMGELAYISQLQQGTYNYITGMWALEQGDPELAARYFSFAEIQDYKQARVYNAIALAEAHYQSNALAAANLLLTSTDVNDQEIGKQLKRILQLKPSEIQTDDDRYQFIRYQLRVNDSIQFNKLVSQFQTNESKAKALLDMAERQFKYGNTIKAIEYFNRISGLTLTDKNLYNRIQHFELLMLASRGELRTLADLINKGITFTRKQELEKILYTALLNEASGDTTSAAANYTILSKYNPFFEEGIIASARYFKNHSSDKLQAYTILTNAIQVNNNSIRLHEAYIAEASRLGFDNFVPDAEQRLNELKQRR